MSLESKHDSSSYRNILKSTSLIGGASFIKILIAMVRTKFVAMLIGPAGVGLLGTYSQITSLVCGISGMGLGSSGVRQIAESVGTSDEERIARTVITLRRIVWLTGSFGMLAMILFCIPISWITFNSDTYALPIAFLGITILLSSITSGQGCVLQGTRRISDIAKINVIGTVNGVLISIPCYYLWGQKGIVPSLILSAIASLVSSWWFARRVPIVPVALTWRNSRDEAQRLLTLGINFMGAGLVATVGQYLIRILLVRQFSLEGVGLYHAAFGLSGVLVGFVLNAMGTDYYPRVTAVSGDNTKVRQMINEQAEISILLALPALAAMMVFAPLVIRIFYTKSFTAAIPILRWNLFGVLGQVFSWPLGFVILAKGKGQLYFFTELLLAAGQVIAVFFCSWLWGLTGTGIAFTIVLFSYTVMMYFIMHGLIGATWNRYVFMLVLLSTAVMVILMLNCSFNVIPIITWAINLVVLGPVTYLCLRQLSQKSGFSVSTLLTKFRAK